MKKKRFIRFFVILLGIYFVLCVASMVIFRSFQPIRSFMAYNKLKGQGEGIEQIGVLPTVYLLKSKENSSGFYKIMEQKGYRETIYQEGEKEFPALEKDGKLYKVTANPDVDNTNHILYNSEYMTYMLQKVSSNSTTNSQR